MYDEADLLPISALQHLAFCERQWGLIHLEGLWTENRLTAEGRQLHDRTHQPETESRGDLRIARGLRLRSLRLGLAGIADVVEFRRLSLTSEGQAISPGQPKGVRLPGGVQGLWQPAPVEYKRGRPKSGPYDEIQLCAQAFCLEEMLGVAIPAAALYYGQPRRRVEVTLTVDLRNQTERLAAHMHELTRIGKTPPAAYEKKCDNCSLLELCMPKVLPRASRVENYLLGALEEKKGGTP